MVNNKQLIREEKSRTYGNAKATDTIGGVTSDISSAILGKRHLRIIDNVPPRALVQDNSRKE
jgi:hypothetical protein